MWNSAKLIYPHANAPYGSSTDNEKISACVCRKPGTTVRKTYLVDGSPNPPLLPPPCSLAHETFRLRDAESLSASEAAKRARGEFEDAEQKARAELVRIMSHFPPSSYIVKPEYSAQRSINRIYCQPTHLSGRLGLICFAEVYQWR